MDTKISKNFGFGAAASGSFEFDTLIAYFGFGNQNKTVENKFGFGF